MKLISAIIILTALVCCKRSKECPEFSGYQVPKSLFFFIQKNGHRLPDSVLNNAKLYFYKDGNKEYVGEFGRAINEGPLNAYDIGILVSREIALKR